MRRVANHHYVIRVPALAEHATEVEPCVDKHMTGIAHQAVPAEIVTEQALAKSDALLRIECVEPVRPPRLLARLDDHSGELVAELIGVDLRPAVLGVLEREGERRKTLFRAQPDVPAF